MMKCKCCPYSCIGIVLSILFAIGVGIMYNLGYLAFIPIAVWFAIGIALAAVLILVIGLFSASCACPNSPLAECLPCKSIGIIIGAVGTILLGIAALTIPLLITSVLSIIIISLGAFFFGLTLAGLISFILCIACKLDRRR